MRISAFIQNRNLFARGPLPLGERAAKRRVKEKMGPHPALRATFSQREKDSRQSFGVFRTGLVIGRLYNNTSDMNSHRVSEAA